ncbi:Flp pilus assembly protein TadG [Devosia subaequoris]|uniref:Flp pilus assembly protein TadG n=1 Tax=Devosia subaequoris TaxID=395930 RepID=A0A7W6IP34_9HYPH|nr:TadE/TadG family type IV pilus assembly protein [Devosia subaequoris]MBB4053074.1 Flp pilus assembly protein TadG [Devosia subaequoris]MCP1210491.1 pilus assembly protein [Devosia subaequoris]
MQRPVRRLRHDRSGTAAIEFAILTPVFLLLLTGMLAYGIYFGAAHSVQQLAADAARTAIAGLNETERNSLVASYLEQNAGDYPLLNPARLAHTIGDSSADPAQYVVRLSYDATDLPIWNLYPPLPLPGKTIAHGATIRRGGL